MAKTQRSIKSPWQFDHFFDFGLFSQHREHFSKMWPVFSSQLCIEQRTRTMEHVFNNTAIESPSLNWVNYLGNTEFNKQGILTSRIAYQMATGQIPDLWDICHAFTTTHIDSEAAYPAFQFLPILQMMQDLDPDQVKRFIKNRETRHVLLSNDRFELVLIHWKPGKASDIHGHPEGGCLFKLLQGKLEELRYTPDSKRNLMSTSSLRKGDIAYIDDRIAYHQVGNPYGSSAISLHVYLK